MHGRLPYYSLIHVLSPHIQQLQDRNLFVFATFQWKGVAFRVESLKYEKFQENHHAGGDDKQWIQFAWPNMYVIFTFRLHKNEMVIMILLFSYVHRGHHPTDVLPRWCGECKSIRLAGGASVFPLTVVGPGAPVGGESWSVGALPLADGWCVGGWGRGASISWGKQVCNASCSPWSHSTPPPPFAAFLRIVCYSLFLLFATCN